MSGPAPEEPLRTRGLRKRPVVDTSTAETVGRVAGVRIDAAASRVVAVVVGRQQVPVDRVIGIGPDAVTLPDRTVLVPDDDVLPRDTDAYGSRLLDDGGTELGKVQDLLMTPDGSVVGVVADGADLPARLHGIGGYAVVVSRTDRA